MDETFQAILDSLPPKQPRSKLEPYAELIQELRKRGRSYREIATILEQRCGVKAGTHTVYNFVRVRTPAPKKARSAKTETKPSNRTLVPPTAKENRAVPPSSNSDQVWQRIQDLKQRTPVDIAAEKKEFQFDENQPLRLVSDSQQKK